MKAIGIQEKKGTYEFKDYHNVLIHCTKEDDECIGLITEVVKIKFSSVSEVFGHSMTTADWRGLVGKNIIANYDRYGKCNSIHICEENKA